MLRRTSFILLLVGLASVSSAAVLLQEDFTSADGGTLPASLNASYDGGVDVKVMANINILPAPVGDHTGGDGYSLAVGDLGTGGGFYNWVFPATVDQQTDAQLTGWVYIDWANWDGTPLERDYLMMLRLQTGRNPQTNSPTRNGYWMLVTANSSWTGISPNPTNFRAFIMKKSGTTHTLLSSYSSSDITTGWHLLSFKANGTTLEGYVDGGLAVSATDSEFTTGYCALGYYEDNGASATFPYAAAWDNFLYESLGTEVSDWTLF